MQGRAAIGMRTALILARVTIVVLVLVGFAISFWLEGLERNLAARPDPAAAVPGEVYVSVNVDGRAVRVTEAEARQLALGERLFWIVFTLFLVNIGAGIILARRAGEIE